MIDSNFELLPVDILFGIFAYLSPVEILQSFLSLNKRFSRIIRHQYVWHICIDGNSMSLSMFNNFCKNMLKLIERRLVSLRITLNNAIGGWSLVSSSLQSHQTTLLRHLHLINIEPFEFDKLLFNRLVKQLHSLIVDVTIDSSFHDEVVEGAYLAKTVLLEMKLVLRLPTSIDANRLRYLSRLNLNCANSISFHRSIVLLLSIFGQLTHLSLKLRTSMSLSDPIIISGDTIQQLCIDRLKPFSSYALDLYFFAKEDLKEKSLLKSFVQAPFTSRKRPRVIIRKDPDEDMYYNTYRFNVYTLPYNGTELTKLLIPENLQISSQMLDSGIKLYPRINEFILDYSGSILLPDLDNCRSSLSLFLPWLLVTKISTNADVVCVAELKAVLQLADNVHTLEIVDEDGILSAAILYNQNDLGTIVNRKNE
ncbi:unnamed protein product [Rotaria magnacalcarata]|uniref:F-box domain-containing protein n=1 Tax=Rotaria magnacalcarata TaxID=392030 RepID=A0A820HXV8_9BILA|nr:unnamed protein product [Rotaria magnacalcarata]